MYLLFKYGYVSAIMPKSSFILMFFYPFSYGSYIFIFFLSLRVSDSKYFYIFPI